ncbi:hypothetical protein ABHA01_05690 [Clostridium paraputrificum]|uniref:hypothetical protein n=1 Tax=Clostridium paraputrificum TaxID=29363 RepID=UPI00325BCA26
MSFIKKNKVYLILCTIAILINFSYYITNDLKEIFIGADYIFRLSSDLSLAFLGSYLFYVINIYIPNERKAKKIKFIIKHPIKQIIDEMETICNIDLEVKLNDAANILVECKNGKVIDGNYYDLLRNCIEIINSKCEEILKYYVLIDDELLIGIHEIYNLDLSHLIMNMCNFKSFDYYSEKKISELDLDFRGFKASYKYIKKFAGDNNLLD